MADIAKTSARWILAQTLWGEARGEGIRGMAAVARVILNRAEIDLWDDKRPDWWGEGVIEVCTKPGQFSCWNAGDPNRRRLLAIDERDRVFVEALTVAELAIQGLLIDFMLRATHYHTIAVSPAWARKRQPCLRVGDHLFYNHMPGEPK